MSNNLSTRDIPDHFLCPISLEIMEEPVICSDGITYEKREIKRWFENHSTSPKTNADLLTKSLIPNYALKAGISKFMKQQGKNVNKMTTRSRKNASGEDKSSVVGDGTAPGVPDDGKMQVYVRLINNTTISVRVDPEGSVGNLMREIEDTEGIKKCHQRLVFAGKQMDEIRPLKDYNVSAGTVVHLILRLVGGKRNVEDADLY